MIKLLAHIYLNNADIISIFKFLRILLYINIGLYLMAKYLIWGFFNTKLTNDLNAGLDFVRIVLESIKALLGAELSFNTESVEPPCRDLAGDPGEVHADQGRHHVVPDRPTTEAPHHRVQVLEDRRDDVLWAHHQALLDHGDGRQLHQARHGDQSVSESPGLAGRPELVGTDVQLVEPVKRKISRVVRSL